MLSDVFVKEDTTLLLLILLDLVESFIVLFITILKNTLSMSGFVIINSFRTKVVRFINFHTRQPFELINGTKWFNLFSLVSFDKVQNKNTVFPLSTLSLGSM